MQLRSVKQILRQHSSLVVFFLCALLVVTRPVNIGYGDTIGVDAGKYEDYGHLPNDGPRCASTSTINSFQFLKEKYKVKLVPGAGTDLETARNALHDGWGDKSGPREGVKGECLQASFGKHRQTWWEAKAQWVQDFDPSVILKGMVFTGGLTEPDPRKWKFGESLAKGAPTWDFLWREISHGEDVEIAFSDKEDTKPSVDHAVTLVGLSFDDKNNNERFDLGETQMIKFLDPNDPTQLLKAPLTTSALFGGSLGFHYSGTDADVGIYLAYSESPVPEPTTVVLMLTAIALVALTVRHSHGKSQRKIRLAGCFEHDTEPDER